MDTIRTFRLMRRGLLGLACLIGLATVTGCASGPFNREYVNVTEQSYAAADMLLQQSKNVITSETPLQIGVLTNIKRPSEMTALGQVIASQIGARFVQLGYNVTTSPALNAMAIDSPTYSDAMAPSTPVPSGGGVGPRSMITGHYAVAKRDVIVNLRVIEEGSGRVLAAYDYSLPLNSDIKELISIESKETNAFGL